MIWLGSPRLIVISDPRSPEQIILSLVILAAGIVIIWRREAVAGAMRRVERFGPRGGPLYQSRHIFGAVLLIVFGFGGLLSSALALISR